MSLSGAAARRAAQPGSSDADPAADQAPRRLVPLPHEPVRSSGQVMRTAVSDSAV